MLYGLVLLLDLYGEQLHTFCLTLDVGLTLAICLEAWLPSYIIFLAVVF